MKDVTMAFRINEAERDQVKALAAKRDVPMSQIIREAIKKYIQEEEK